MKNIDENLIKTKNIKGFWKKLWNLLEPSQKQIKNLSVMVLTFELFRLIGPYIVKLIIDKLTHISNFQDLLVIFGLIILMFLAEQSNSLIHYFKDKMIFKLIFDVEYYLPIMAQKKLVYLPLSYHEKENTGNKIVKIDRGVDRINNLIMNLAWEVGPTITQLVVTLFVLLFVDWRFGLSFAFFIPFFVYVTYKANKEMSSMRKERHEQYEVSFGKMGQSIININTVKSFVQEKREIKEFEESREKIKKVGLKEFWKTLNFGLIRSLIIDLGRISMLFLGAYFVWKNILSIGTFVFVMTLSEKSYSSLFRLSRFYDRVEEGAEAVNRFIRLIDEKSEIESNKKGYRPKGVEGQIEFDNLSFGYDKGGVNALNNINLKINANCITALVGPSGGGKTTVTRMIYRHYDPKKGKVLLDGKNLKDYDLYSFRKFIAIVPQDVEIFNTSVKDNIAYAKPEASQEEVEAAAKIANADEFIVKLPEDYNTEVGERGIKLSGGQRQRIGIARAVLANPRILIFDEATSNLDSYSEKLIQDAMSKISKGKTVIIIAHRLSTIKKADKIIVLENGNVVEQGSHYELAKTEGGLYAKLLKLQQMGDIV